MICRLQTFWEKFSFDLWTTTKCWPLTEDNQLLIADDFSRTEYAVYDDVFTGVKKNYVFQKSFNMSDVIYIEYNNDKLDRFTKGLFEDYSVLGESLKLQCEIIKFVDRCHRFDRSINEEKGDGDTKSKIKSILTRSTMPKQSL